MRVGQLLAQRRQILQPLPSDQIVEQQHVALQLGDVLGQHPVEAPQPAGGRLALHGREHPRLVAQQMLQAIGDPAQRRPQRLAQRRVPAVLVDQLPEQGEVRFLRVVRARVVGEGDGDVVARLVLEPLRQIADQLLEQISLTFQAILQARVRILDDDVERARRA